MHAVSSSLLLSFTFGRIAHLHSASLAIGHSVIWDKNWPTGIPTYRRKKGPTYRRKKGWITSFNFSQHFRMFSAGDSQKKAYRLWNCIYTHHLWTFFPHSSKWNSGAQDRYINAEKGQMVSLLRKIHIVATVTDINTSAEEKSAEFSSDTNRRLLYPIALHELHMYNNTNRSLHKPPLACYSSFICLAAASIIGLNRDETHLEPTMPTFSASWRIML